MSFQFNFPDPNSIHKASGETSADPSNVDNEKVEDCREIFKGSHLGREIPSVIYNISKDICLKCLDNQKIEDELCRSRSKNSGVVKAAESHSDLIPNVYEGGLKVWECTIDLVKYLLENHVGFKGCKVLDLGCGAGLAGILALQQGAKEVHFQDYNTEVIEYYTIPNVEINCSETTDIKCKCRYFSGDWTSFSNYIAKESMSYDVILTAETIYKPDNYCKLTHIFTNLLSPAGKIYVAAKSNYFGVGGGTKDFLEYLNKENILELQDSFTVKEDIPREILVLSRQSIKRKRKLKER